MNFTWAGLAGILGWAMLIGETSAAAPPHANYLALDVGVYGENLKERFSVSDDYRSLVGTITGVARVRRGFHLGKSFYFEPSLALALPWRSGVDGTALVFPIQWGLNFMVPILRERLHFRGGPGIHNDFFLTKGGPVTLNNGTSTSTFYLPNRPMLSIIFTVDAGFEIVIYRSVALNLDLMVLDIASTLRRRYNGAVTLGIRL